MRFRFLPSSLLTGVALLATLTVAQAQNGSVAVNTDGSNADASALLDVKSTTQGVLVPRMSAQQRGLIGSPATGLLVYQTDAPAGFYFYNGTAWTSLSSAGATGPQGPQGIKGDKGDKGDMGTPGLTGATGPQGPQGIKGDAGVAGATGPQGIKGDKGDAGATGAAGAMGATGPQGPIGLTGPTGPQGAKGDKGDAGATGSAGATGLTGATGPQGPIGLTGPQGVKGDKGDAGAAGATGPQGPIGLTGPTGAMGPQGIKGDKGDAGAAGATGATGPQGPIGLTGPQGVKGDAGATGLTGSAGATGPQGAMGPQGVAGQGVPTGGTTGQVLSKVDGTNYNTQWTTPSGGGSTGASLQLFVVKTTAQTTKNADANLPDAINFSTTNGSGASLTGGNTWNGNTFTVGTTGAGLYTFDVRLTGSTVPVAPMLDINSTGYSPTSVYGVTINYTTLNSQVAYSKRGVLNTTLYLAAGTTVTVRGAASSGPGDLNGDASCRFVVVKLN
jgi:Collagen triple helix repeat (20 copies)